MRLSDDMESTVDVQGFIPDPAGTISISDNCIGRYHGLFFYTESALDAFICAESEANRFYGRKRLLGGSEPESGRWI